MAHARASSVALAIALCAASFSMLTACFDRDEPRFRPASGVRGLDSSGEREVEGTRERTQSEGNGEADPTDEPAAHPRSGDIPAPADVAAPPPDAQRTRSGLATKVLRPGTGTERPGPRDRVTVHYTGWTTDGEMFDSSVRRGRPATFRLDEVIAGWTEGLQQMVVGERRRLWIPEELAYRGRPGAPQGMLVFDVELIGIERAIPAPEDVAAPPPSAERTASGLASRVLRPGVGSRHPTASSRVEVHYTGWTTDGQMFDTSTGGDPAQFRLDQVIPGWTEGLQRMVEGERRRLWIPEELAYRGRPGAPQGMLVFDVELIRIVD